MTLREARWRRRILWVKVALLILDAIVFVAGFMLCLPFVWIALRCGWIEGAWNFMAGCEAFADKRKVDADALKAEWIRLDGVISTLRIKSRMRRRP